MSGVPTIALAVILGVPIAGLFWHFLAVGAGVGSDFVIRRGNSGRIDVRGRIPRGKFPVIREFCLHDLAVSGSFTVRGSWGPGRVLRLRYTGRLDSGQRQRIRNFLLELLR